MHAMENPFYKNYDTQFEIPPFAEIEEKHIMPAFLKGGGNRNKIFWHACRFLKGGGNRIKSFGIPAFL